jgi:uncharacterized membrane protein
MMNDWGWMGSWGWGMGLGWLVVLVLAGLIGWMLGQATCRRAAESWHRGRDATPQATALETLERRYAGGELSDEQFERMRLRLQRPVGETVSRPSEIQTEQDDASRS